MARNIDWSTHGDEIVALYLSGHSVRDIIPIIKQKHDVTYHSGTLTNFLGRRGVLRTKSEAHKRTLAKSIRICELCEKEHAPRNYNQRWCDQCTGFGKYTRRIRIHGLPAVLYESMFEKQQQRCKICDRVFETCLNTQHKKTLFVDHDHKTNQVRGLLCPRCNSGVSFIDDEKWHSRAQEYLNEARLDPSPVFVKPPRMRRYARGQVTMLKAVV